MTDTTTPTWAFTIKAGLRYETRIDKYVITVYKRCRPDGSGLYHFRIAEPTIGTKKPGLYQIYDSGVDPFYKGNVNPHIVKEQARAKVERML